MTGSTTQPIKEGRNLEGHHGDRSRCEKSRGQISIDDWLRRPKGGNLADGQIRSVVVSWPSDMPFLVQEIVLRRKKGQ